MKALAKLIAVLSLALGPAALLSVMPAQAQPPWREERRGGGERRSEARPNPGRHEGRGAEGRPPAGGAYRAPPYSAPSYPAPNYPAPGPVYRGAAPYGAPGPGYAQAPPRGNSLGAEWGQQQDQARMGVRQGRLAPLGQVITRLKRDNPGRLLDAGLEPGPDGRAAYRLRWAAKGGRRVDFIVDAVTGQVMSRTGY